MFLSGGSLYFAEKGTGDLYQVPFDAGVTAGPASSTAPATGWHQG